MEPKTRRMPEEDCQHVTETIIVGKDNPWIDTQIQCEDCWSVRISPCYHREDNLTHEETF